MSKWAMTATFVALAIFLSVSGGAGAEQAPLRIAMTMADIPLTNGAPDQGTEGIRFLGYTVYDPLVRWDLSRADRPAKLVPGLATSWKQDTEDPTRWIFELRQGVRFHDGSLFDADAVIWNFDRTLNENAPQFDRTARALTISAIWPIAAYRKLDDWHIELQTNERSETWRRYHPIVSQLSEASLAPSRLTNPQLGFSA
jgi:peptide/nickel transport system substrate-binding protein